jgi:hypothetical protein
MSTLQESDSHNLKADLPCGFQKLRVPRDENVTLRLTRGPGPRSSELKRIGSPEGIVHQEALCLDSQCFTRLQLPPSASKFSSRVPAVACSGAVSWSVLKSLSNALRISTGVPHHTAISCCSRSRRTAGLGCC